MKTIAISDEIYKKLEAVKNGRSFSETIDGLISGNVGLRIENLLETVSNGSTGRENELASVVQGMRKRARASI